MTLRLSCLWKSHSPGSSLRHGWFHDAHLSINIWASTFCILAFCLTSLPVSYKSYSLSNKLTASGSCALEPPLTRSVPTRFWSVQTILVVVKARSLPFVLFFDVPTIFSLHLLLAVSSIPIEWRQALFFRTWRRWIPTALTTHLCLMDW